MLDDIKLALRLMDDTFDREIEYLIEAAKADLKAAGISKEQDHLTDVSALIHQAIILYSKANFGQIDEKYTKAYEHLKTTIRLSIIGR